MPPESRKRFKAALALLEARESQALIFTKVDRASRRTEDFARLIRLSEEQGWRLIVRKSQARNYGDFPVLRSPVPIASARLASLFAGHDHRCPQTDGSDGILSADLGLGLRRSH